MLNITRTGKMISIRIGNESFLSEAKNNIVVVSTVGGKWRNGYKYTLYRKNSNGKWRHFSDLTGRLYDAKTFPIESIKEDIRKLGLGIYNYCEIPRN